MINLNDLSIATLRLTYIAWAGLMAVVLIDLPDERVASQCRNKTDRLICSQSSIGGTCAARVSDVLRRGLPPLPGKLTYQMSIPVAYWTASLRAVVFFLGFSWSEDEEEWFPQVTMATFMRG